VFELLEELRGEPTDVYVVHLQTGHVRRMEAPPFYSAHHVNAYETAEAETDALCYCVFFSSPSLFSVQNEYCSKKNLSNFEAFLNPSAIDLMKPNRFDKIAYMHWLHQLHLCAHVLILLTS
jgi:carotenoid cleavage dioxygenase-like enzyme